MSTFTETARARIQAQGFCDLDDKTYAQLNYPLRLSPAICMTWAAVGTALASAPILWALVPFAALVAAAFVNVSTGFCIPSFVVRLVFGKVPCAQTE
jgi:hypothetical protein